MKYFLAGIIALFAFAAADVARAADMPAKAPPAPAPVSTYNWTGWYVGGNIGYGWGANTGNGYTSFIDPAVILFGPDFFALGGNVLPGVDPHGITGGGQIGYDWQVSPLWVLGVVADLQASSMKASAIGAASIGAFTGITESNSAQVDWFGTVRGKVGYAANNFLVYGTGGLAYGEVKANTGFNDPSNGAGAVNFAGSTSSTKAGWSLGGGVEYALSSSWRVGAEYLYVNLGTISTTETQSTRLAIPTGDTFTSNSKFNENIARVFINYKFSP